MTYVQKEGVYSIEIFNYFHLGMMGKNAEIHKLNGYTLLINQ